jgi:DNA invertase Pin-like site-specific DNA recombinase
MNTDQRDLAQRLLKEGKSVREVARTFSVHPATLYRILATSPIQFATHVEFVRNRPIVSNHPA